MPQSSHKTFEQNPMEPVDQNIRMSPGHRRNEMLIFVVSGIWSPWFHAQPEGILWTIEFRDARNAWIHAPQTRLCYHRPRVRAHDLLGPVV